MSTERFFDESREQSLVKAEMVSKYFWAWAKVIVGAIKKNPNQLSDKLAYIDLFAGPGRYKDGAASTPLLVLKKVIEDQDIRNRLVTIFNDKDEANKRSLEKEIAQLPGIDRLKYKPQVYNEEVGAEIVNMFEQMKLVPTLFFVDPWGYKGLSLQLVNSVLKDWGCDCIFFFNYNRINMGLSNPLVTEHMNALFGEKRANQLRAQLKQMSPRERELAIVEEISSVLKDIGGKYVLPFCFKNDRGNRTSHHLIFVSKHVRGYEIMKEIMAKESSKTVQGVPSFEYNPADKKYPLLFELSRPLKNLAEMLLQEFAGCTMKMGEIYRKHHINHPYIKANYKQILLELESQGRITTKPPADKRRKRKGKMTFADRVRVSFPARRNSHVKEVKH